jgi:hypothetical protein
MSTADEWLRDVITHINALNASGAALAEDSAPEYDGDDDPATDCLICLGTDPDCWADHSPMPNIPGTDERAPTLAELEAAYGTAEDPTTWPGPTEAELPTIVASIKKFARIGDPNSTFDHLAEMYHLDEVEMEAQE